MDAGKRQALGANFFIEKPARRPVGSGRLLGNLEGYVAFATYHIHQLGRADDGSAFRADILDAAILAGAAPALGGRGGFAIISLAFALALDPDGRLAVRGNVAQFRLLGDPGGGFRRQIRYRPSIGVMVADGQAVGFGGFLEFLVVVVSVVGHHRLLKYSSTPSLRSISNT